MPMLKTSMTKAGSDFLIGSLTFKCMPIAPSINTETTRAAGKTKEGIHIPKISKKAAVILVNPTA